MPGRVGCACGSSGFPHSVKGFFFLTVWRLVQSMRTGRKRAPTMRHALLYRFLERFGAIVVLLVWLYERNFRLFSLSPSTTFQNKMHISEQNGRSQKLRL